jgi:competence protein ComEC
LVAYYFNLVTPVSTPANIVAVPLCGLVLMSNLAGLLFAAWCPWATELFNHAGWFLMELIRITSAWFASWPKAYFYSAAPGLLTSLVYYLALLSVLTGWVFRRPMRPLRMFGIGMLCLVWLTNWWAGRSVTRMTILSLNGGYAIYSDFPGKKNDLLIDCGTTNAVQFLTKPFLRAQGVNRLPALLLSHGDLHQVGGALLMEQLFGADQILVSPLSFRSAAYKQTLTELKARSIPLRTISRGDTWAGWSVLHPDAGDSFAVADDKAIVLARTIFGQKMLLLSDLGRPGQEALLERASDLQADILIAGLPAKPEALSDGLLDAVQPRVIVVCDSEFPATARARPSLRDRLAQRHITVIYTRLTGAVTFEFAKKSWELRTMSGLRMCEPVSRASVSSPGPGGVAIRER